MKYAIRFIGTIEATNRRVERIVRVEARDSMQATDRAREKIQSLFDRCINRRWIFGHQVRGFRTSHAMRYAVVHAGAAEV